LKYSTKFYGLFLKDINAHNFISNVLFDHSVLLTFLRRLTLFLSFIYINVFHSYYNRNLAFIRYKISLHKISMHKISYLIIQSYTAEVLNVTNIIMDLLSCFKTVVSYNCVESFENVRVKIQPTPRRDAEDSYVAQ